MKKPLISVCIPTWNRWYSIGSVVLNLCQEIKNHKINANIIISDNCSTDSTEFQIKNIQKKYNFITYSRNLTNIWPMKNVSKVLSMWTWEYLRWLWSDDLIVSWWLKITENIINEYSPNIIIHTYLHKNKIKLYKNEYYNNNKNIFIFYSQKEYLEFLWDQYNYDKTSYDWFLEYLLSVFSVWVIKKEYYLKMKEKIINEKWKMFFDNFSFIHILCNTYEETNNPIILVCDNYLDWDSLKKSNIELDKKVRRSPSFSISNDSCFLYNYLSKKYNLWKNFKKLRNKNNFYWTMSAIFNLPWIKYIKQFIEKTWMLNVMTRILRRI
jgi:hypothetical protein